MTPTTPLTADILFIGATRPPMRWGVTYTALLINLVVTMELFLTTRNLLVLLLAIPLHALSALLCLRDARIFELLALWLRFHLPTLLVSARHWRAAAYGPLTHEAPRRDGHRAAAAMGLS